jgi:ribosomal protein L34E
LRERSAKLWGSSYPFLSNHVFPGWPVACAAINGNTIVIRFRAHLATETELGPKCGIDLRGIVRTCRVSFHRFEKTSRRILRVVRMNHAAGVRPKFLTRTAEVMMRQRLLAPKNRGKCSQKRDLRERPDTQT